MLLNSIITSYNITEGGSVTWTDLEGIGVGGCTPPPPWSEDFINKYLQWYNISFVEPC